MVTLYWGPVSLMGRACTLSGRLSLLLSLSLSSSFSVSLSPSLWFDVCGNHNGVCGNHTLVVEMCRKQYEKCTLRNATFRRLQLRRPLYSGRRNPWTPDLCIGIMGVKRSPEKCMSLEPAPTIIGPGCDSHTCTHPHTRTHAHTWPQTHGKSQMCGENCTGSHVSTCWVQISTFVGTGRKPDVW